MTHKEAMDAVDWLEKRGVVFTMDDLHAIMDRVLEDADSEDCGEIYDDD